MAEPVRKRFIVRGQVQGVGFRPFVYALAGEHGLTGMVRNSPRGVVMELQGPRHSVDAFARALPLRLPPLARILGLETEDCPVVADERGFVIAPSTGGDTHAVLISPDTAVCADCLADMADPADRRFAYAFTNCTNCGPRYTITRSIPYDRQATSMACFAMCADCLAEYADPADRRFHAQPNACPVCGPTVRWRVKGDGAERTGAEAIAALADFLLQGGIAAIKGLGGFHLACDAANDAAVALMRTRKHRPHKPFALMAADLAQARRIARIGPNEEALLLSPEHPVVICPLAVASPGQEPVLSSGVSPDTRGVGIMLPYTPLHRVLLDQVGALLAARGAPGRPPRPAVLVMTSGNPGGQPICLGNREAQEHLSSMADGFLFHDRDILVRVDDSVLRPQPGGSPLFYRRARGYVPRPILVPSGPGPDCILGVGAEIKNTLCLTKGDEAYVSQHIGDMANVETAAFHREIRDHLAALLRVRPQVVVRDPHPGHLAGAMAEEYAAQKGIPVLRLQHHFAHAHAVLAENGHQGRALVLALDGTGLGSDGHLWGGEFLYVDTKGSEGPVHRRLAHFAPLPLPGGEAAIREPWRIAHALLLNLGMGAASGLPWLPDRAGEADLIAAMLARGVNTPLSTSCGRLFDAAAALAGLCTVTTYEGQAAIRLEEAQYTPAPEEAGHARPVIGPVTGPITGPVPRRADGRTAPGAPGLAPGAPGSAAAGSEDDAPYPCPFGPSAFAPEGMLQLDTHALFSAFAADLARGVPVSAAAVRLHQSLAAGVLNLAAHLAQRHEIACVGLSGGCMQNVTLSGLLVRGLERRGMAALVHKELPPGDGCISFGQAAWARLLRC